MSNSSIGGLVIIFLVIGIFVFCVLDWPEYAQSKARAAKDAYWKSKIHQPYGATFYRSDDEKERHEHEHREDEKRFWVASKTLSSVTIAVALVAACFAGGAYIAARDQASTAGDQEHRQLRAYLGPIGDSFDIACENCVFKMKTRDPEQHVGNNIFYTLRNFGATPAVAPYACVDLFPFKQGTNDDEIKAIFEQQDIDCRKSSTFAFIRNPTVWPSDNREQDIVLNVMQVIGLDAMVSKREMLIIFGEIIYPDVFGVIHHTYICRGVARQSKDKIGVRGCSLQTGGWQDD